ncbi:hypothetical protein AQUCO_05700037v1 [Aquilegia coerulea]|uniref:Peroxisomal and mitochondrial division factor 2-like n=1 Tax=Aquilegia coerulea TaxID=218851 RepID=A0A2G5CFH8_AQUCA|nr:hypothetical protein AQUCO_05700037v1 [Aquilegia coerulea]PIA30053.1 hypothetical protein AQUCO_05700037v1 [Aquilegia coerulea]
MAEETIINGKEDVGIEENKDLIKENEENREKIKLLMDEIEELKTDRLEMKKRLDERNEADKKTLEAISTRAAELEIEVSRLQHDLGSTMGENDDLVKELKDLKKGFEVLEKEKVELMGQIAREKEENEKIKGELEKKEKEIVSWKMQKEEIESKIHLLEEALKNSEGRVGEMEVKSKELQSNLEELNEKKLVNGDAVVASESQCSRREFGFKGVKVQWPAALASTGTLAVAAAAAVYIHYAKKR